MITTKLLEGLRVGISLMGAVTVLAVAACDFNVSNPGPVEDEILNDPASHRSVVNGAARTVSDALSDVALQTGAVTRESMASGNLTISVLRGQGLLTPEDAGGLWSSIQEARWVSEDAVRRLTEVQAAPDLLAEAALWAGFGNRFGANLCEAVIDGGPAQSYTVMLERAVEHFTTALELSANADSRMAALAGRASALVSLGDLTAAAADASQVPDDLVFQAQYSAEEPDQYNALKFYAANTPYRVHSVWNTPFEQYYLDTGDPRTPWTEDPGFPFGEVQRPGIGNVPFKIQLKFVDYADEVNLVSGREMRLVEAEALLADGEWQEAMAIVNGLRTNQISLDTNLHLQPWVVSSLEEAWTAFRRERGIELWLEGRRMADLRRWKATGAPGQLHPLEDPSNPDTYLSPNQTLCIPISQAERETNINLTTG